MVRMLGIRAAMAGWSSEGVHASFLQRYKPCLMKKMHKEAMRVASRIVLDNREIIARVAAAVRAHAGKKATYLASRYLYYSGIAAGRAGRKRSIGVARSPAA